MSRWWVTRPLSSFLALAYLWTWSAFYFSRSALTALSTAEGSAGALGTTLAILAPFGPTISALVLTALVGGRVGLRELWRRCRLWRVGAMAYLAALTWLLVVKLLGAAIWGALAGGLPEMPHLREWYLAFPRFLVMLFVGGPLGEEIGWRGYALPRLIDRQGPLTASASLGVLWALWHLPVFFIRGLDQYGQPIVLYALMVTAYSFVFTWLHLLTRGSLLIALLQHTAINVTLWLTSTPSLVEPGWRFWTLHMPGPWLVSCGLAWAFVAVLIATGAYVRSQPPTVPRATDSSSSR